MKTSRAMMKASLSCILWLSIIVAINASDPDPLQDFCVADITQANVKVNGFVCKDPKAVNASDFLFRGLGNPLSTNNSFGFNITQANVQTLPGINTLGISINHGVFAPGGLNPPHIHPRASEIIFVMEGTILVGFISTNNVLFSQKLEKGDVFVIPRGLVHFQQNVGASSATTITALNSQLPGVQVVASAILGANPPIPQDVLAKAFNVNDEQIKELIAGQSSTPASPPVGY
ncbi:germin-like protein 1-1 [Cryptomeria japonica]|uniref:germin-like protein 1-1 n=1 Tax=Cryptomeria japonica TaxID=3369 RepID=UPI0025AD1675|nr:germin-like protein 1-1 [Cryptomeria japonica]